MRTFCVKWAIGVAMVQSMAFAQAAPETKDAPVQNPVPERREREEDLVVLKDGSRYRGTIVETVPDDHILIEVAKDTVRQVSMADVVYAGPLKSGPPMTTIAGAPTQPRIQSPASDSGSTRIASPGEEMVHFQSKTPGLVVWVAAEPSEFNNGQVGGFERFCDTPCSKPLRSGIYRIAYSVGADKPLESKLRISIQRETWLEGAFVSNRSQRVFGWIVLGLGAATGTLMLSTAAGLNTGDHRRKSYVTAGVVGLVGGLALGLPLGLSSDKAIVVELSPPELAKNGVSGSQVSYNGFSFVGRF